ncbi:unnamed protein product [Moneuplotes crassus]|uniref:Uncharacterized protein n=1 Tax=Euplotes crassus TaxID=5936 RepID=A0AAD2D6G5_EUPCR|nr:unnamed protein product [Moneuplotes crassus]
MGAQNSSPENGAVLFEDDLEIDQEVHPAIKEAFLAQAERLPNGELGVRASKLKNVEPKHLQQSIRKSRVGFDEEEGIKSHKPVKNIHAEPREFICKQENHEIHGNFMCNCKNENDGKFIEDDFSSPNKEEFLSYEQYVDLMNERMGIEKNKMKGTDIVFESKSSNVSCLFWPY